MNQFSVLSLAFCCWWLCSTAGNTFEGHLTLTSDKNGIPTGKTMLAVKNDLVAIAPGAGPQMVLNVSTGEFRTVVNQGGQKLVAKLNVSVLSSLPDLPSFLGSFSEYFGKKDAESEVQVSDEVKIISGYKCRNYIVKTDNAVSSVWAAEDFPFSLAALMDMLKVPGSINNELKALFPLQASIKSGRDVSIFKVEVEKKTVDDSLFTMPSYLLEMDMTALVQQMIQTNDPAQVKKVLDSLIGK